MPSSKIPIQLLVKDDRGTPEGAREAAQQAIAEGAELIIGPLFAASVQAAAQVARAANRPIIAFSTDASVASRGVYLLSFMPENEVERVVSYAAAQGRRSFAALIPETPYGNVVEAAFQQSVSARGGRVAVLERYPADKGRMEAQAKRVAGLAGGATPATPCPARRRRSLAAVAQVLEGGGQSAGQDSAPRNDPRTLRITRKGLSLPRFGRSTFAGRYRAKFGTEPTRIGTLAYDAWLSQAALERTGACRFTDAT